jgi:hypothetical protein
MVDASLFFLAALVVLLLRLLQKPQPAKEEVAAEPELPEPPGPPEPVESKNSTHKKVERFDSLGDLAVLQRELAELAETTVRRRKFTESTSRSASSPVLGHVPTLSPGKRDPPKKKEDNARRWVEVDEETGSSEETSSSEETDFREEPDSPTSPAGNRADWDSLLPRLRPWRLQPEHLDLSDVIITQNVYSAVRVGTYRLDRVAVVSLTGPATEDIPEEFLRDFDMLAHLNPVPRPVDVPERLGAVRCVGIVPPPAIALVTEFLHETLEQRLGRVCPPSSSSKFAFKGSPGRRRAAPSSKLASLKWKTVLHVAISLCRALEELHTQEPPVLHNNICPETILLSHSRAPVVKLWRFGKSVLLSSAEFPEYARREPSPYRTTPPQLDQTADEAQQIQGLLSIDVYRCVTVSHRRRETLFLCV